MSDSERNEKPPDSFIGSIRPLLIFAQFCGLAPVAGIRRGDLKFTWGNPIHIYGFFIFVVTTFFDICYTVDNFNYAIRIDVFASTIFYSVCLITTLFFLEIAKTLPEMSTSFAKVETHMKDFYGYPKLLGLRIKIFLSFFIFLATIEHGTLVFINLKYAWKNSGSGGENFGYHFFVSHFPSITKRISYSAPGTFVLFWVNAMCTFNWNFIDFFLIVVSMEISSRFALINSKLKRKRGANADRAFWNKIREDYNRMSLLTKNLDRKLSKITLTSFFSNMYHISLQLLRSLKMGGSLFRLLYFYFSLSYLIARLLLVLFFAAKINDESKKPVKVCTYVQNPCGEASRFFHQVHTDEIALTGNKLFVINQKFFVSVIGTICTYQGVLLQFNSLQGDI